MLNMMHSIVNLEFWTYYQPQMIFGMFILMIDDNHWLLIYIAQSGSV